MPIPDAFVLCQALTVFAFLTIAPYTIKDIRAKDDKNGEKEK
jgi:hypothetical protein